MDPALVRVLTDKLYEKRKATALELEKLVRDCHVNGDVARINQIIDQLIDLFIPTSNALHVRNGGLIGLAATAIALGVEIAPYMPKFMDPLLACFSDLENRVRYFACESLYNIAKVSKGEILVYFNPIFDALSKLVADTELSVKNGAELLDRLLRDIVAESASVYVPQFAEKTHARLHAEEAYHHGVLVDQPSGSSKSKEGDPNYKAAAKKAFSLTHFIPLLADRMYVVSPLTRSWLVGWITVLDSVPDLELVTFLPDILDSLLKYLSDPTQDVRVATENLLADFLREVREVTLLQKQYEAEAKVRREADLREEARRAEKEREKLPDITMAQSQRAMFVPENGIDITKEKDLNNAEKEVDHRDTGVWIPGQGVHIDHPAIVEILLTQFNPQHDETQRSAALRWIAEYLEFAQEVMIPFTPRLIPVILPNLAHHVEPIRDAALHTDMLLFNAIQNQPSPSDPLPPSAIPAGGAPTSRSTGPSPPLTANAHNSGIPRPTTREREATGDSVESTLGPLPSERPLERPPSSRHRAATAPDLQGTLANASSTPTTLPFTETASPLPSRPQSPAALSVHSPGPNATIAPPPLSSSVEELDLFDYQATVNSLTIQFLSEHEQTRVAALKWLIMLHQKAPKKILAMDDGTFPALLKTLSDSSEEVIKHDLRLLAQISSHSEEGYFKVFMINLLELFSTDRRLLEHRGSLIIRQLCISLNAERIYRTFAEIIEKEEELEFASVIVQKLNMILITSPELSDFRKRLKSLETRQDGQVLFTTLYRCWCHNPVAVFSLCLLAQAYEHASNLLTIFADLEITVPFLVQLDKLVQLIESPVFTYLRLQLLEPEKYPYLFKCLYGLLMLLPQSSAFTSLRIRLTSVSSMGFAHIAPRGVSTATTRSKIGREEIKWPDLLAHFRTVQMRHDKARRQAIVNEFGPSGFMSENRPSVARPGTRRRVSEQAVPSNRGPVLSPLNPKARPHPGPAGSGPSQGVPSSSGGNTLLPSSLAATGAAALGFGRMSPTLARQKARALSQNRPKA